MLLNTHVDQNGIVYDPKTAVNMPFYVRLRPFVCFNTSVPFFVENTLQIKDEEYLRIALCWVA
jgi:hypothetical protein